MIDTEEQLARLKQRIAVIDRKYAQREPPPAPSIPRPVEYKWARSFVEEWSEGEVVKNEFGEHFQTERLFPAHKCHGSADIGALSDLPHDLLDALGGAEIPAMAPGRWAFLDTETTGLAGGSGTYAFLIGVGRITPDGFRVRQFFMREYAEERSVLAALEQHLNEFDLLITYNGKSYDQPLLETRYRMTRHKPPFGRLGHLDLLHGSRRLWKLRLESCRLMQLEEQILGFYREGDLPSELIPYVYFEYLRSREAQRVVPILHHNAIDILTLACLTAIVPAAFRSTDPESLAKLGVKRGEDLAGIARWLLAAEEHEPGLAMLKRAVDAGLPDGLLFRALWDIALLEKKLGRANAALSLFTEIAGCRNDFRANALEELAKYYEHEERNYGLALEFTKQALGYKSSPALRHRGTRLERRLAKPRNRRLL
ncbi:MAG: ribonuclease H-like domain-containing protein [Acidobacteriota bacterium]|nr:ribonuclease H-like domain-containing protein [Acidobacteriota bacterium]